MALIRGHHSFDDHYTQIPNDWLRDDRLTLEARGLLAQIMSHRPGWHLSIKSISKQNRIGRDKVRRILDELLGHGYLERSDKQSHDEKGRLTGYDYTTRDPEGVAQKPCKVEPRKAEPYKGSRSPKNTISKNNIDKNTIDIEIAFDQFWSAYPVKKDKALARRSFEKALKRATAETIIDGAIRHRDDPNREQAFTKHPSTWLNADAWENPPEVPRNSTRQKPMTNNEQAALLAMQYRQQAKELESGGNPGVAQEVEMEATNWLKGTDDL